MKEEKHDNLQGLNKHLVSSTVNVKYPIDLQTFLPYRMHRVATRMGGTGNNLSSLLKETDAAIGEREWRVIGVLGAYTRLTNSKVVELTGMDAATITRAVKTLKKIGFVETRNSKRDRRKIIIVLTESGAKYHDKITPKRIETGETIDSCFDKDEKSTLLRLLDKLDLHLKLLDIEIEEEWE